MRYPINLDVEGKICAVVGGGRVALRKIRGLLEAGAEVFVIAPELCDELRAIVDEDFIPPAQKKIIWLRQNYEHGCLPRGALMIAATNDPSVNRAAAQEALEKNMLVNVVDGSALPNNVLRFENPSTIRRGALLITVSTGGTSPALSKFVRRQLENIFPPNIDLEDSEVNIRNALDSHRTQSQNRAD